MIKNSLHVVSAEDMSADRKTSPSYFREKPLVPGLGAMKENNLL